MGRAAGTAGTAGNADASDAQGPPGHAAGSSAASADRYEALLATEAYRESRRERAKVVAHLCRRELAAARRIADLGAGTGIIKKELEQITGKQILGFDIDIPFVVERERMTGADVLRLPVRTGSFDLVIANHLYEHVDDQAGLFREIHRALVPGGLAYVSAGSRLAVIEPHYRLPFLSWLPRPLAGAYVRATRRGSGYEGIRFRTYGPLVRRMREAGLIVHDETERAIDELLGRLRGRLLGGAWRLFRRLPRSARAGILRLLSPQWFFLLEKPGSRGNRMKTE